MWNISCISGLSWHDNKHYIKLGDSFILLSLPWHLVSSPRTKNKYLPKNIWFLFIAWQFSALLQNGNKTQIWIFFGEFYIFMKTETDLYTSRLGYSFPRSQFWVLSLKWQTEREHVKPVKRRQFCNSLVYKSDQKSWPRMELTVNLWLIISNALLALKPLHLFVHIS